VTKSVGASARTRLKHTGAQEPPLWQGGRRGAVLGLSWRGGGNVVRSCWGPWV